MRGLDRLWRLGGLWRLDGLFRLGVGKLRVGRLLRSGPTIQYCGHFGEPFGGCRVRVRVAQRPKRVAKAIDMQVVPRLTAHQVLGYEARLRGRAARDVGVHEQGLRLHPAGVVADVDADVDHSGERRNVPGHARYEATQSVNRHQSLATCNRWVDYAFQHTECRGGKVGAEHTGKLDDGIGSAIWR